MNIYVSGNQNYFEILKENGTAIWLDELGDIRVWNYSENSDTIIYTNDLHVVLYFKDINFGLFDNCKTFINVGEPPVPPTPSYLLLEDGDYILLEDGDKILLQR